MTRRAAWLFFVLLIAGCQCRPPGPVEPIALGLRVQPAELDFGRVLEGSTRVAIVTLTAATRAPISVQLGTQAPFSVATSAEVPGGGDVEVPISFRAGNTEALRVLKLTVGDRSAELTLRGVGVRPTDCRPSAACVVSVYSLEEDRCIESQAADDAPCDTGSACLEQGRCRSGQCLGIARRCDDNDKCTDDACAMDLGCIHTPHTCPTPAGTCRVATCDSRTGCGEGAAPDLTLCGPQDCVRVNFCFSGMCRSEPTPEGLPCSPPIACLPEAQCRNQVCARVTTADWVPSWSARLSGEPVGGLASSGSTLFFSLCLDAGFAQSADAGPNDADAGADDGGTIGPDADGGLDAGAPGVLFGCSLTSYTGTGFERYDRDGGPQPNDYADGALRSVVAVNAAGVLLQRPGGLELRSPVTGALRSRLDVRVSRSLIVLERDRVLFWADGGVQAWVDGGVTLLASVEQPTALGRGAAFFSWNPDAGMLTRLEFLNDGGVERRELWAGGFSSSALAVSSNDATLGSSGRAHLDGVDGGLTLFDWTGADASAFADDLTLSSSFATNVFYLRCDGGCGGPEQETHVRVFDTATGSMLWEVPVVNPTFPGTMLATTLVDGRAGGFTTLVRAQTDGGSRAVLAFFADGERKAACRLPDVSGAVEQAHFSTSALVVTVRRADGSVVLESYDFGALPVSRTSWSTPQGVAGTRSDRP